MGKGEAVFCAVVAAGCVLAAAFVVLYNAIAGFVCDKWHLLC
jgi:hypothetical protein